MAGPAVYGPEIGGYFELELPDAQKAYHEGALRLNSARNCLLYLVQVHKIQELYLPAYTCPVVWEMLEAAGCRVRLYEIGPDFLPCETIPDSEWIVYNNYFGICGAQAEYMHTQYSKLILDCAQAYYFESPGVSEIYSPRKFFGLPDGGELIAEGIHMPDCERDVSLDRTAHLLKRIELGASAAYEDFQREDGTLICAPIRRMSRLTERLLLSLPFEEAARRRRSNYLFLHNALGDRNLLDAALRDGDVPMVYPFLISCGDKALRGKLIDNRIYVAKYWSGQKATGFGAELERRLLPLPVDQRYTEKEMKRIVEIIYE